MKNKSHRDITVPNWNWRFKIGFLRFAYMTRHRWNMYGATPVNWFFFASRYDSYRKGVFAGRCFQITILGFQIGFMYSNKGYNLKEWK
jgi:hypothetical protein